MSGASDTIDPIDAARDDVAGSKDLIASAVEDLSQHQLWLENYRLAETKRARRVRRQELMLQAELTTKRIIRALRRFALLIARAVRATWRILVSVSVTVARAVASASIYLYGVTRDAIAWTAPRVQALALATGRLISDAVAWTVRQSQALALATGRLISAAVGWVLRQSQALALATGRLISSAFAWTLRQSRALALATARLISAASAWTLPLIQTFARGTLEEATLAYAWTAPRARTLVVASHRATAAGLAWLGAESHALARASLKATSVGLAWLDKKTQSLARASLKATSGGVAFASLKGRQASAVVGQHARRGAAAAKRAALAAEDGVFPSLTPENSQASSEAMPAPSELVEPQVEDAVSEPGSTEMHSAALATPQPRRAKPHAIRASRRELRQSPRVAGRRSPR